MATLTIAQALASTATGIIVSDTAVNIAAALPNTRLVARVSLFELSGACSSTAAQADVLATLGVKFSTAGYTYTVVDTVADLTAPAHAAGLAVATAIEVSDTATNIAAAASIASLSHATWQICISGAINVATQMILDTVPGLTIAAGQTLTVADTVASLLSVTPADQQSWVYDYAVSNSATVTAANLVALFALPRFFVPPSVTLTVADSAINMTAPAAMAALASLSTKPGLVIAISDTWANLAAAESALHTIATEIPATSTRMTNSQTVTVAQLEAVAPGLPNFSVAAGQSLTLADTLADLLAIPASAAAVATNTHLTASANVTVAQLDVLTGLRDFSPGAGISLTVVDTSAHIATLTQAQLADVTGVQSTDATPVVTNTVGALIAAGTVPAITTQINAKLDGGTYTVAQVAILQALTNHGATLTLVPETNASTLLIADTTKDIAEGTATITALRAEGAVTVSITDSGVTLSAADAAAFASLQLFSPSVYGVGVADAGSAITSLALQIFGHGFAAITVTSGVFAGTVPQLLDPTLHFGSVSSGVVVSLGVGNEPSAQLSVSSTVSAAQAVALALLPGFTVAPSVTLAVQDTMANLVAASASVEQVATAVAVTDSETLTAASATKLAAIETTVGASHFSLGSNLLTVSDLVANLTAAANAVGIALANSVTLSANTIATAAQAEQLIALGAKFTGDGNSLTVADTAADLVALAAVPATLTAINTLASHEVLTANATVSVATAETLLSMTGFSVGGNHLILSDTAADLLASAASGALAVASAVQLSAAATVTVANAVALAAMPGFSVGGSVLTIADTPAHLAALAPAVAAVAGSETLVASTPGNIGGYTISAAQLTALLALPNLSAAGFTGTITVSDTAADLAGIAALFSSIPPGSVLADVSIALSANATVTAAAAETLSALPGFALSGHVLTVQDTPADLLSQGVAGGLAIAGSVGLNGAATVTASQAASLVALSHFITNGYSLTVSDTPAALAALSGSVVSVATTERVAPYTVGSAAAYGLTATQFTGLTNLPHLSFAGFSGTITVTDTAPNLASLDVALAGAATGSALQVARGAMAASLSAAATVTATQLSEIAALPGFSVNGYTLTVQDTPTALLAAASAIQQISSQISATELAANGGPWVVTLGQAQQLAALPHFNAGPAGEIIADTPTNILLPTYAAAVASATEITLNGNATVTVADAEALHALSNFTPATNQLIIEDGAAHLATLDAGTAAMASAIQLQDSAIISVTQFDAIAALPNYMDNGKLLVVADTAANLLNLVGANVSQLSEIMLSSNALVSAAQAEALVTLPNFTAGIAHLSIQDTAADLLHVTGSGSTPDDWAGELAASAVTLTANATVTAAQAAELASLGSRFSLGGHTLTVSDTATNLLSPAYAAGVALASETTLSGAQTVSAQTATELAGLADFSKGGSTLTISDTAADLEFSGYAAGLSLADAVQLNTAATPTVAGAEALVAVHGFQPNVAAPVTIADSFSTLLTLAGDDNNALHAMPIELSANATATVAQLAALSALPQYGSFSLNGYSLTLADTAQHIAAYTPEGNAVPTSYMLSGDGTVTAAQADLLASENVNLNGNTLTIVDTAAALLDTADNGAGLALATADGLSGAATLTVAQLAALESLPNFATDGHPVTVRDTVSALLSLSGTQMQSIAHLQLTDTETVTAATLTDLAQLGSQFSLAGNFLIVSDTANALAGLDARELALTVAQQLSHNATVTAAEATELATLPNLSLDGSILTVSDTTADLLDPAYAPGLALASVFELNAPATVTVAQAAGLLSLPNFVTNPSDPIVIADTFDNLLALGTGPGSAALEATPIELSANATVSVAQLAALAALPQYSLVGEPFSLNGHTLTLLDTGTNLANYTPDSTVTPTTYVLSDNSIVTAAQADILPSENVNLNGNALTIEDTAAALLDTAENGAGLALATADGLSGNATVDAAGATALIDNPQFSTGGFQLVIADSAENLLALPSNVQQEASLLELAAPETVSAQTLVGLTMLGIKFSEDGNALIVADSATALAALNPLETALVVQEQLNASGTVDAATANALASLPNLVFNTGASLTVQDTVANLLSMSPAAAAIATAEQLAPGSNVTITAGQGDGLAALNGFSAAGSTITVADSLSDYDAAGFAWQAVATSYQIVDTVHHLLTTSDAGLLAGAASVTLASDAVVDASTAAMLAGLTNFSDGTAVLTVVDTAAAIAANAAAIQTVATYALIDASTPITAAQAEELVPLSDAGVLGFIGSNVIAIVDNYADLSNPANAAGMALASSVTVLDNAANLLTAIGNDWGGITPFYELDAGATITAQQAATFAGPGANFLINGQALVVSDTAAAIAGNAAAISDLGVHADVVDTAADVGTNIGALLGLGGLLHSVYLTDTSPVSAATAAALDPIVSAWSGPRIAVADTAAAVSENLIYLALLGIHLSGIAVDDTAANVAAATVGFDGLQILGGLLTVTLTDVSPVTAAAAAGLLPVLANLVPGTVVNVSDTVTALGADAPILSDLGSVLGAVTVSGSTTTTATIAAELVPIESKLAGVSLHVVDSAPAIAAAFDNLLQLQADNLIGSIAADGQTVAEIMNYGGTLVALGATATISDTAAAVDANLDALEAFSLTGGLLQSILLTDSVTPTLTMTAGQLTSDSDVLALITSNYHIIVSDSAADVLADLSSGESGILADLSRITAIHLTDGATPTLTMTVAQLAADAFALPLIAPPFLLAVRDTASDIANDLALGSGSFILAHLGDINAITLSAAGPIVLAEAAAVYTGVATALDLITNLTGLQVAGVTVAQIGAVLGFGIANTSLFVADSTANVQADLVAGSSVLVAHTDAIGSIALASGTDTFTLTVAQIAADAAVLALISSYNIAVSDTVADVQTDLASGTSVLVAHEAAIQGIAITGGTTITLTEPEAVAPGVAAMLNKIGNLTGFDVTGVSVAEVASVVGLGVSGTSLAVSDSATNVQADLASGTSVLVADAAAISGITLTGGTTITLAEAEAVSTGVAAALSAITNLSAFDVTWVTVAQIGNVLALNVPHTSLAVSDSAADVQADLASDTSVLVAGAAAISGITLTGGTTITLTESEAVAPGVTTVLGQIGNLTAVAITNVTVAQVATVEALDIPGTIITVSDTAADVQADFTSGHSVLIADAAAIGSITLTGGSDTLTLTVAQIAADTAVLAVISSYQIAVNDTATNVQADLASGTSVLVANSGAISGITLTGGTTITLTEAEAVTPGVTGVISEIGNLSAFDVTGVTVAEIGTVLALGAPFVGLLVTDSATNVQADLASGSSSLVAGAGAITSVTLTGGTTITLTEAEAVTPGVASAVLQIGNLTGFDVTGVTVAQIGAVLALDVRQTSIAVTDTAADVQADLASGASVLTADADSIASITLTGGDVLTLTVAQFAADAAALSLLTSYQIVVSDIVANVQADLASGSSVLVANSGAFSGITLTDGTTITLTEAEAVTPGVAGVISEIGNLSAFDVTGVTVAEIGTVLAVGAPLVSLLVTDIVTNVQGDLASLSSALVTNDAAISSITLTGGTTITLTEAAAVTPGVATVLGQIGNLSAFDVTGVALAQVATVFGLDVANTSIAIGDSAANVGADLALGASSVILNNFDVITSIVLPAASTVTLTEAEAVYTGVAAALELATNLSTFAVTGVTIAQISSVLGLGVPDTSMVISDTVANVQSDLTGGSSVLEANSLAIGGIMLSSGTTLTLSVAQAVAAGSVLARISNLSVLDVTGVAIDQITSIADLGIPGTSMAVADNQGTVQNDLTSGSSVLVANAGSIGSLTLQGVPIVDLTEAETVAAGSVLQKIAYDGIALHVSGVTYSEIATVAALNITETFLQVSATAAQVTSDLTGGSSVLVANSSLIQFNGITLTGGSTSITLTETQAAAAGVATVLNDIANLSALDVTGVTVAQIGTVAGLNILNTSMTVSDTAANVQADLALGASSVILGHLYAIESIILPVSSTITLTEAEAVYAGVAAALNEATNLSLFAVTGVTMAQISTVAALDVANTSMAISDSASNVQADLALGASSTILANAGIIGSIILPAGSTITLTEAEAVYAGVAVMLNETTNLSTFAVSGVTVAQIGIVTDLDVPNTSMAISDTAADVQADLALGASSNILVVASEISGITLSGGTTIILTEGQATYAGVAAALELMINLSALDVTGVAVAQIGAVLALGIANTSISVSDSAAHVQADLAGGTSVLVTDAAAISGTTLTGGTTITLTETEAVSTGVAAALSAITNLSAFDVTGVAVAEIGTVLALGVAGTRMAISDTAANIDADLTSGSSLLVNDASHIGSITLTDPGTALTLTVAQMTADAAALNLISSYQIAVSDTAAHVQGDLTSGSSTVLADLANIHSISLTDGGTPTLSFDIAQLTSDAAVVNLINTPFQIAISDTAAAVQGDLTSASSALEAEAANISAIDLTDSGTPTITLTVAQLAAGSAVIAEIASPFQISINDTAAHVQADLASELSSHILSALSAITSIVVPGGSTITLSEGPATYGGVDDSGSSAIAIMSGLSNFVVTNVTIADIPTVLGLQVHPAAIQINDSVANIVADLNGSDTTGTTPQITTVTPTDSSTNVSNASTIYNGLPEGVTFNESGLTISDTAVNLLAATPAILTAAETVTLSANATGVTAANATILNSILGGTLNGHTLTILDIATNLLNSANDPGIALATDVQLSAGLLSSAAYITQLAGVHAFDANGQSIVIADTLTNLLDASYAAGIAIATAVELNNNYTVTAAQLIALSELHSYTAGSYELTVHDTASAIAALTPTELGFAYLASVSDTSANVAAALDSLQSAVIAHGDSLSITLTDGVINTPSITVTAATYSADQGVIEAITTTGSVKVTGDAADLSAIAGALANDASVGEVDVTDSAADILANLTALDSIGSKFKLATITDTSINASEVSALLTIPNLTAINLTITDTGSQIAAAIEANGAPGLIFMNAATVALSGNSIIAASDAVALEQLTSLNKNGYGLYVWDTASHLTDSVDGYLSAVSAGIINGVYLKTTGGTATITAATAATLLSISGFSKDNPPTGVGGTGGVNTLIVSDTAAHIDANYAAIYAHESLLSGIVVSGSATITDAVFNDLLTLGATTAASLTVRDTAAAIFAGAPTQLAGSITAAAWQLSASATVTEAEAAFFGSLPGFSAGAYTLTLSGSATISVSAADDLGNLGSSLKLGGYSLYVDGNVATITSMSSAAKLIVTPNITDTFTNIAGLGPSSGVLGGTISVTDSEAVTYTQVENFLALLKPDNASGVAVANVSFGGHTETVTDTLAHIESLTSYSLWTDHVSVQSDFSLVVADTIATLINPANTAALETMSGTTLNGNQNTTAANAESLFAVESTIKFSLGANQITILDTAANILNPVNSDGEAMATAWDLSANATVNTADAETLLTASKFSTNDYTLTVSDTSANLLDGILPGDINSSADHASVVVQLSDAETLDAQTAEALVSLPGFTNNGDLSIADDSSYLLMPGNHTAELDATSVTLAGNETVSVATAVSLAALPNFTLGSNTLYLASNDYANAAALKVLADFGAGFNDNAHSVMQIQDNVALTPTEYTALGSDNILQNGHALSAMPVAAAVTSTGGDVMITATGVGGATLNVYAADGASLSSTTLGSSSISVTQADDFGTVGGAVVITETMAGHTAALAESAPIIALDQTVVTTDAGAAIFATSGQVQVGTTADYMNLYTAGSQPTQSAPELVYDPNAHTLSLDVDGGMTLLVTLGAATHPTSLEASEIFIKHFV